MIKGGIEVISDKPLERHVEQADMSNDPYLL